MIEFHKMDICDSQCDFICHQVNCRGAMNSGVAKAIREKWPVVYDNYRTKWIKVDQIIGTQQMQYGYCDFTAASLLLGTIQCIALYEDYNKTDKHQYVINMFAQNGYGYDGKRYTSYDAFWLCLGQIRRVVPKGKSIAFPYKIGCGRGGANWEVIYKMIEEVLGKDYTVHICWIEEEDNNDK